MTGSRSPASSPSSSSSWCQSARRSPLPQMGLAFCSVSFDTSSAVDGRERRRLPRSIPCLPRGSCSLARNVIRLVCGGDFSRCYLGGRQSQPPSHFLPLSQPSTDSLLTLARCRGDTGLSVLAKPVGAYALGCRSYAFPPCGTGSLAPSRFILPYSLAAGEVLSHPPNSPEIPLLVRRRGRSSPACPCCCLGGTRAGKVPRFLCVRAGVP